MSEPFQVLAKSNVWATHCSSTSIQKTGDGRKNAGIFKAGPGEDRGAGFSKIYLFRFKGFFMERGGGSEATSWAGLHLQRLLCLLENISWNLSTSH